MTNIIKNVYCDSCILISWLKKEQRKDPQETEGIKQLINHIQAADLNMITSVLTKCEVLECTLTPKAITDLENVLLRQNVILADTNEAIWKLTMRLRNYYKAIHDGLPTLTIPDAVHLATAITYEADIFYSMDEKDEPRKRRALIPLSGNVGGYDLKIEKPLALPDLFTGAAIEAGSKKTNESNSAE